MGIVWTSDKPDSRSVGRVAVFDDFNRSDTTEPGLGTPPIGGTWLIGTVGARVPGPYGCIRSGRATCTNLTSAGTWFAIQPYGLGGRPVALWMKGYFKSTGQEGGEGFLAMGVGLSLDPYVVKDCLHLRLSRTAINIDRIKNDVFTNYATATFTTLSLDTPHLFYVAIDPRRGQVRCYLNGQLKRTFESTQLAEVIGVFPFWECVYSSGTTSVEATIDEVGAIVPWGWANSSPDQRP